MRSELTDAPVFTYPPKRFSFHGSPGLDELDRLIVGEDEISKWTLEEYIQTSSSSPDHLILISQPSR